MATPSIVLVPDRFCALADEVDLVVEPHGNTDDGYRDEGGNGDDENTYTAGAEFIWLEARNVVMVTHLGILLMR